MGARRRRSAALVAALALAPVGCGGDETSAVPVSTTTTPRATAPVTTSPPARTAPRARPAPAPAALPGLPRDTAGFDRWPRLNAAPIPPDSEQTRRVGFDAHRGVKNVYVDSPAAAPGQPVGGVFAPGTVVVKAGGDDGVITLIAIMRKVAGSDPEHGDWEFVEYIRSGAGEDFTTDARLSGPTCWSCHAIARETDWVFTPPASR